MFGFNRNNDGGATKFTVARSVPLVRDVNGAPAVSLDKVEQTAGVSLRKKSETAGVSLKKHNVAGVRAQVVLLIDHSGSMSYDYQNNKVQELTERALAFGLQLDADGEIPVIPFDSRVWPTVDVTMANYKDIVAKKIYRPNEMGGTEFDGPLKEVRKLAEKTDAPIFCCILTDGNPWNQAAATSLVCDLARYPVFIKFMALRDVPYLQMLDDLGDDKRLLDNVDTKTFSNLDMSDEEFADAMSDEFAGWIELAIKAGILTV
jgi:uncharacterized protein YegL